MSTTALPVALSVHALRLHRPASEAAGELPVSAAVRWLAGVEVLWDADGGFRPDPTHRLYVGLWQDEAAACAAVRAVEGWLPGLAEAERHWSTALRPYMSRGQVNWNDAAAGQGMCRVSGERPDPERPIVTISSFGGFVSRSAFQAFGRRVFELRRDLRASAGALAEFQLYPISPTGSDPCTITLWRNEAAVLDWAYRQEAHRGAMEWLRTEPAVPRLSFNRLLPLESRGAAWMAPPE